MKSVYQDENNVILDINSVELKPCINRESKSLDLTIKLYSCHYINMKFLVVVTPPSIYHKYNMGRLRRTGKIGTDGIVIYIIFMAS